MPHSNFKDITGQKYGMLTVMARAPNNSDGKAMWFCKCDCGKDKIKPVTAFDLKNGKVRSCGCLYFTTNKINSQTHGLSKTRIHRIWKSMKLRCKLNPKYKNIMVCDEWINFEPFYNWAVSNGYNDNLTIDRINTYGNYEPQNCRWATYKQQNNNKTNSIYITVDGETHTPSEWSDITGINKATILWRIKNNWPERDLLIQPNLANRILRKIERN